MAIMFYESDGRYIFTESHEVAYTQYSTTYLLIRPFSCCNYNFNKGFNYKSYSSTFYLYTRSDLENIKNAM